MFTIRDIIDLAIRIERNGEKVYREAAQGIPRPDMAALLLQLADEEVKHAEWLSDLEDKVTTTTEDSKVEETGKKILQGILGDESFSLKDADFSHIEDVEGLLRVAIEFEEDTLLFYEMIRSFIDDKETLDHLDTIIEEEHRHVSVLKECLQTLDPPTLLSRISP
jgi:rubrerythrin